eukprot:gnl/MRDRNA2_/MRDRNA2_62133_c1_seq1.p1 gnl/MRDRNA2_/MRDRNA2_62133_c1~~gnl/MRDRNA2_/MRDRNA2_62133_c1_seq1.p1  ORF type:complete len:448 (-),score=64.31 gnl/MRDRNA2_/MRDRNA2_62133_c1_seq1:41-1384(-)
MLTKKGASCSLLVVVIVCGILILHLMVAQSSSLLLGWPLVVRRLSEECSHCEDHYEVLGLVRKANRDHIKKAYQRLASKWHPDKNPIGCQAVKTFKRVSEAYAVLSNDDKRAAYDSYIKDSMDTKGQMQGNKSAGSSAPVFIDMDEETARKMYEEMMKEKREEKEKVHPGKRAKVPEMATGDFFKYFDGDMGGMSGMGGTANLVEEEKDYLEEKAFFEAWDKAKNGCEPLEEERYDVLPKGTQVMIQGIQSQPELNGQKAKVEQFDSAKQRYTVIPERQDGKRFRRGQDSDVLDMDSKCSVSVSTEKLVQLVPVHVRGLTGQTMLNRCKGTITGCTDDNGRYIVEVRPDKSCIAKFPFTSSLPSLPTSTYGLYDDQVAGGKTVVSLKPENVMLPRGVVVKVVGVFKQPELNGRRGKILSFDHEEGRYSVQMSRSEIKQLKPDKLRPG